MVGLIRRFSLLIMLVSAVAIPYAMVGEATGPLRDKIQGFLAGGSGDVELVDGISDPEVNRLLAMQQQVDPSRMQDPASMNLTPTVRLEGVLRFDVTPRWVLDNWPHVSTTRISGPLDGLRVPLITGTGASDVVGSLTYYFDNQQQVQRISVDGIAGDDRHVVSIVTRTFELKPEPTCRSGHLSGEVERQTDQCPVDSAHASRTRKQPLPEVRVRTRIEPAQQLLWAESRAAEPHRACSREPVASRSRALKGSHVLTA